MNILMIWELVKRIWNTMIKIGQICLDNPKLALLLVLSLIIFRYQSCGLRDTGINRQGSREASLSSQSPVSNILLRTITSRAGSRILDGLSDRYFNPITGKSIQNSVGNDRQTSSNNFVSGSPDRLGNDLRQRYDGEGRVAWIRGRLGVYAGAPAEAGFDLQVIRYRNLGLNLGFGYFFIDRHVEPMASLSYNIKDITGFTENTSVFLVVAPKQIIGGIRIAL